MAGEYQKVKLVSIDVGEGLKKRLADMGLVRDTEIVVINNSHPGPFVISVKNCRLILGKGMAHKIMVK